MGMLGMLALLAACTEPDEGVLVRTQAAQRAGQGGTQSWYAGERHGYEATLDSHAVEARLQDPRLYRHVASLAYDPDPHVAHIAPVTPEPSLVQVASRPRPLGEAGDQATVPPPQVVQVQVAAVPPAGPGVAPEPNAPVRAPIARASQPVVRPAGPAQPAMPQPGVGGVAGGFGTGVMGGGAVVQGDDTTVHFSGLPLTQGNEVAMGGTALGPFAIRGLATSNGGFPTPALPPGAIADPGSARGYNTGATFLVVPSDLGTSGGVTGIGAGTASFLGSLGNGMTASVPGGVFANPLAPLAFVGSPGAPVGLFQPGTTLAPGSATISGQTTATGTFAPTTLQTGTTVPQTTAPQTLGPQTSATR